MVRPNRRHLGCLRRCGFTLLESLIAASILFGVVTAVTAAIVAGQQHSYEAQERVAAALAAEALMGRIVSGDYDTLAGWNGFLEPAGAMTDEFNLPLPDSFGTIGREVIVETTFSNINPPDVNIRGRTVRVRAFNRSGRELIELARFVAEPKEQTTGS